MNYSRRSDDFVGNHEFLYAKISANLIHFFGDTSLENHKTIVCNYLNHKQQYDSHLSNISKFIHNLVFDDTIIGNITESPIIYSFCIGEYWLLPIFLLKCGFGITILIKGRVLNKYSLLFDILKNDLKSKQSVRADVNFISSDDNNVILKLKTAISNGNKIVAYIDGNAGVADSKKNLIKTTFFSQPILFHQGVAFLSYIFKIKPVGVVILPKGTKSQIELLSDNFNLDLDRSTFIKNVITRQLLNLKELITQYGTAIWDAIESAHSWIDINNIVLDNYMIKKRHFNHSFTIINADNVNILCGKLKLLYNKKVCCAMLICFVFLIIKNLFLFNIFQVEWHYSNPLLVGFLILISFFAHEFGHSSAICHYGKNAGKIGFGLLLFAPIMFSDVSECWRLTKHKRIIVDLGGIYFQIIFANICLLIYLVLSVPDFLYATLFSLSIGLINLNPFIKMDGYWLLSDILDVKNLKSKAVIETKLFFKQLFIKDIADKRTYNYFLIIYCVLNSAFAVLFFLFMMVLEFRLLKELPNNISGLFDCIHNNQYSDITLQTIESIILPIIVLSIFFLASIHVIKRG